MDRSHEQSTDTVFVSGFSDDASEDDIKQLFGSIGIIKLDKKTRKEKIYIYKDKGSGKSKGECTVTYDDPEAAKAAVTWFNGKEFKGKTISVAMATHRSGSDYGKGGGRGFKKGGGGGYGRGRGGGGYEDKEERGGGGGRGRGGGDGRAGDWRCPDCNNNNFSWRNDCNRCRAPKPSGGQDSFGGYGGGRDGYGGGRDGYGGGRDNYGGGRNNYGGGRENYGGGRGGYANRGSHGPMRDNAGYGDSGRSRPY